MRGALRQALERSLLRLWFAPPASPWSRAAAALLWPACALARFVAARRRKAVRRLPPGARPAVVVIGNLTAGGTGKTPATAATASALSARGWRVGVLCAGYRAQRREPRIVTPASDPRADGDEAVLLALQTGLPVAAGRLRGDALALLSRRHPDLDLVVSDDGLQHPGLDRTLEVGVFDERGAGNGRMLPAGPLREPLERAGELDAILLNGCSAPAAGVPSPPAQPRFRFDLRVQAVQRLDGSETLAPGEFAARFSGRPVAALAGIGHPERFFAALAALGLEFERHAPGDHARLDAGVLGAIRAEAIVMTAKDAVKCRELADRRCWVVRTDTRVDPAFIDWIEERLRGHPTA